MKLEVKEISSFRFEPEGHKYFWEDRPMSGVTTILNSVLAKPALLQWGVDEAVNYIENWAKEKSATDSISFGGSKEFTTDLATLKLVLKEARLAHRRKKEEAGQKGTDTHATVEEIIKDAISKGGFIDGHLVNEEPQVSKFVDWAIENKVQFLTSETPVYDNVLFIAGTPDFTAIVDGKKVVGDIKTGKAVYYEAFLQMAAYRMMLENDDTGYEGAIVVRLSKDGDFETQVRYDYETDKEAFLACLKIYRAKQTYEI